MGAHVPRYFFNIVHQGSVTADHEGQELDDFEHAKAEAIASARDVARQDIAERRSLRDACIEIRDGTGRILGAVNIRDVIDRPGEPDFGQACRTPPPKSQIH